MRSPRNQLQGIHMPTFEVFRTFEKKREFILKVTFSLLSPTLVDQWMDPVSLGGFRQTVLQVQSPQKSSCHCNIPTWEQASLRSWRYLLCFEERVTTARKVNGGWNRKRWGRGRGEKAFFSLPSPHGPSSIIFLFVLILAFAPQLRRLQMLIP